MSDRDASVLELWRQRSRNRFLRVSLAVLGLLAVYSWTCGEIDVGGLFSTRRLENLERFVTRDIIPFPLRGREFDVSALASWAGGIVSARGIEGMAATLAISALAIVLAGAGGLLLALPAARNLMSADPFLPDPSSPWSPGALFRRGVVMATRAVHLFLRAIPEYVWAYLLLAMLGPTAWPAVIALALHNAGILGKLGSEAVENLEVPAPRALRGLGAGRGQIVVAAVLPLALPRFLLYFFYRFETCIREATVLGMLGIVSLGYWIRDARSNRYYDEMLLLVLLGAALVLFADVLSALVRRSVRRAA